MKDPFDCRALPSDQDGATAELMHVRCLQSFNTLRTQEQLGYLVFLQTYTTLGVRSIAFIIQSTAFSAAHIEGRVQAFIHQFSDHLAKMTSEEFLNQACCCCSLLCNHACTPGMCML